MRGKIKKRLNKQAKADREAFIQVGLTGEQPMSYKLRKQEYKRKKGQI